MLEVLCVGWGGCFLFLLQWFLVFYTKNLLEFSIVYVSFYSQFFSQLGKESKYKNLMILFFSLISYLNIERKVYVQSPY